MDGVASVKYLQFALTRPEKRAAVRFKAELGCENNEELWRKTFKLAKQMLQIKRTYPNYRKILNGGIKR